MDDTNHLNVTQIAALLGKSKAVVSRRAAAGDFGKPHVPAGATFKRYNIVAIERSEGRTFTAAEIAAAQQAHGYTGPKQSAIIATMYHRFLLRFIAARDDQWRQCLAGQTLSADFTPPPFPATFEG